ASPLSSECLLHVTNRNPFMAPRVSGASGKNVKLERSWVGAAIREDVLAADVAGVDAAQERADRAELVGAAEALRGNRLLSLLGDDVDRLAGLGNRALHGRAQAV